MTRKTIAIVLAGGAGKRLDILSAHRAKPAVPFAGKYRIIDFVLSNCVNSNIYTVGVLTQYLPRSLSDHIGIGKPWDLDRTFGGITLLPPYQRGEGEWYNGTANAVYQNMNYILENKADNVIILAGDHIYKMNYQNLIKKHERLNADVTIAVKEVDKKIAHQFGILEMGNDSKIISFQEKPENPKGNTASMGVYIFKIEVLKEILIKYCGPKGGEDFGKDIIPKMIDNYRVHGYKFRSYWRDVGTIEEYWKANLELIEEYPPVDLYEEDFKIHTKSEELPAVKFGKNGLVRRSLISNGCIINGKVENSVISPGVIIEEGAIVTDSIIFNGTIIKKDSVINKSIIDKKAIIGKNTRIGLGDDYTPNKDVPEKMNSGINIIGKFVNIPDTTYIERNCRIMSRVTEDDFKSRRVKSGETVYAKEGSNLFKL